jgi:hypothetical protein
VLGALRVRVSVVVTQLPQLKLGGSLAGLTRQVSRYASLPSVGAVLVVSMRARHAALPERIAGKPLRVVTLGARGL